MEQTLLSILEILKHEGFAEHIYGNPENWYYNGKALPNTSEELLEPHYDEQDTRILLYKVTSSCGQIKGVAII